MTQDSTHNGWTNYATWRVNVEMCEDYLNGIDEPIYPTTYALAHAIEEYVTGYLAESTPEGIALDYALAFVANVNWYEIAENHEDLIGNDNDE